MLRVKDVVAEWAGVSAAAIDDGDDLCDIFARGGAGLKCADAKQDLLTRLNKQFPGTALMRQDLDRDAKTMGD